MIRFLLFYFFTRDFFKRLPLLVIFCGIGLALLTKACDTFTAVINPTPAP